MKKKPAYSTLRCDLLARTFDRSTLRSFLSSEVSAPFRKSQLQEMLAKATGNS